MVRNRPEVIRGAVEALPGAINVIPGEVRFTLDIRAPIDPVRTRAVDEVLAAM